MAVVAEVGGAADQVAVGDDHLGLEGEVGGEGGEVNVVFHDFEFVFEEKEVGCGHFVETK